MTISLFWTWIIVAVSIQTNNQSKMMSTTTVSVCRSQRGNLIVNLNFVIVVIWFLQPFEQQWHTPCYHLQLWWPPEFAISVSINNKNLSVHCCLMSIVLYCNNAYITIYDIALAKRAFWLADTLDPFPRGLHAKVSLLLYFVYFFSAFLLIDVDTL